MIDLEARKKGIGGSEIAAIIGISPWKSPLDIWLDKTNRLEKGPETPEQTWGHIHEDSIAKYYAITHGVKVEKVNYTFKHNTMPLIASIDRAVCPIGKRAFFKGKFKTNTILECKTSMFGKGWGESGTQEIPIYYLTQVQHYMGVLDMEFCDVAVLIGTCDYRDYRIPRNDAQIKAMQEAATEFWNAYVLTDTPPPPRTIEDVEALYKTSETKTKIADKDIECAIFELKKTREEIKKQSSKEKELKDKIASFMLDSDTLQDLQGVILATYKTNKRGARPIMLPVSSQQQEGEF